ncbi:MAG TPA: MFS transporter [Verrucomicrobiae bacterium]|nr:MFS transporter [Verrucomicrobiae bacterium]
MNRKPSLLVIFLSVFIDLIGFGIVLPLLPGFAEDNFSSAFSQKGLIIGGIIASFSAMQFFFAPAWGKLSDRIGRRPVMLISNLGAAGSYALFAFASSLNGVTGLWMLLVSRIFAGICGANLSVASAYIADISPPEKRSARMGLIGMAFGLGFILGPSIGAFALSGFQIGGFSLWGNHIPAIFHFGGFGKQGPGWVAAGFCAANFILGWFILGESRRPNSAPVTARPKFAQWSHTLAQPKLGLLIAVFFFATFCFTCFESTFPLLAKHGLSDNIKNLGDRYSYLFTYAGFIAALVQGVIGRLVKKFGEPKLIFGSLIVFAIGLATLPYTKSWTEILIVLALLAIGSGLNRPPVFGMISLNSSPDEQGANLGVAQSFGALARILGPIFANVLFFVDVKLPYVICGGLALVTAFFAWNFLCRKNSSPAHAAEKIQAAD